jgi:NADH-quinone oxidoreductase subunit N
MGLTSVVNLQSFTVFPEYFISVSILYVLIVVVLITYNVYGLMLQKSISECLALVLIMACYLIINDDLLVLNIVTFNKSIVTDYFAYVTKIIVCLSSAIYFLIIANFCKEQRLTSFEYLIITMLAVLGLVLLCSSNDLLTAYLAIELSSLSFYILASFKKTSSYSVESGLKYFIIGAVSSAFFLLGSSFIYGLSGSINFTDFYGLFENYYFHRGSYYKSNAELVITDPIAFLEFYWWEFYATGAQKQKIFATWFDYSFVEFGFSLIIFSLFIKLALAPFHLWSLDVYEGSPTNATFFFAVICKLSVFVLLVRLCLGSFYPLYKCWQYYAVWVGVLSVFVGSFGGLRQRKLKTLLAYSSISHMGYILLALSSDNDLGLQMAFFYLIIYIIVGLATWFTVLSLRVKQKSVYSKYNKELGDLVLLNRSNPALAFAFALTMFSVAGIPPMVGFLAKMSVFITLIDSSFYFVGLVAILLSVISTFYYLRIIKVLYFENGLAGKLYYPISNNKIIILSILIILLVFLFINPTLVYLFNYKIILTSIWKPWFYLL